MGEKIALNTDDWMSASNTTQAGNTDNNDLLNDVLTTINSLMNVLNTVSFMENIQNFKTALEDFGYGMNAALACISLDLQVVTSGLSSAARAFATTDAALAKLFGDLDSQVSYYTSTATSITLSAPTAAQQSALNALTLNASSNASASSSSFWDSTAGHVVIGVGIAVVVVAVVAAAVILLPAEAVAAAGAAVVAAGAAVVDAAGSLFSAIGFAF